MSSPNNNKQHKQKAVVDRVSNGMINHFINGATRKPSSGAYLEVFAPATGKWCGMVALGSPEDVDSAVKAAQAALPAWKSMTVKSRAAIMYKFRELCHAHKEDIADLVVLEHGKNRAEAHGSIAKGLETVEWACSMSQMPGHSLEVSRGVTCKTVREPVGVCASVLPFNFPIMVGMWTLPICITAGNAIIVKPSEKVPMTMTYVAELLKEAGVPDGIVQIVHGQADVVNLLCDHPDIKAVSFVGSSRVAELVSKRCRKNNKRVLALGGAKNHLVALQDCDIDMCAADITRSFVGCTGQRCMAASVLLLVGEQPELLERIVQNASSMQAGQEPGQVGPVIDAASRDRILRYINEAETRDGAKVLLDGRSWANDNKEGFWVGPTVLLHKNKSDAALKEEIFGPVLSVLQVDSRNEAISIENGNPYGNAACVYTSSGAHAEWFSQRFSAGMVGVNIGVPVPREPFTFGGMNASKFGSEHDITGQGAVNFFTTTKKVTTKWAVPKQQDWMS